VALYRKYRPATFAEVVGQEHVTAPLSTALDTGRINHAYLFSGPRGCGKTSSARILARSLNCEKGPTSTPCGQCRSCVSLGPGGGGNLDVTELDAASHGGVDDTRELRDRRSTPPPSRGTASSSSTKRTWSARRDSTRCSRSSKSRRSI
jgi:DNA polymerase III subunit gamma/tau